MIVDSGTDGRPGYQLTAPILSTLSFTHILHTLFTPDFGP